MKRTIKLLAGDEYKDLKVSVDFNSKDLTRGESERDFNKIVDSIIKALLDTFYYNEIRRLK